MFPPFQWHLFFLFYHLLFEFWWHPPPFSKSFYFGKELLPNLATVLTDLTAKRLTRREIFRMLWEGWLLSLHAKQRSGAKFDVGIIDLFNQRSLEKVNIHGASSVLSRFCTN